MKLRILESGGECDIDFEIATILLKKITLKQMMKSLKLMARNFNKL